MLIFGDKKKVEELTKDFPLYSNNVSEEKTKTTGESIKVPTETISSECTIESAENLAEKYLTDTRTHCQQVWKIMRYFAQQLWEDEERRYIAWLLHDIDWDVIWKNPEEHLWDKFLEIVSEISMDDELISDIRSHYEEKWVPVDTTLRKYLISVDELSWFLYAYSLLRPTQFEGMARKWIKKRLKDKAFARGVDRDHVQYCEKYLDIPLQEFALQVVEAMKNI